MCLSLCLTLCLSLSLLRPRPDLHLYVMCICTINIQYSIKIFLFSSLHNFYDSILQSVCYTSARDVYISIYLYHCISISLYHCISVSLYPYISLYISVSLYVSLYLYMHISAPYTPYTSLNPLYLYILSSASLASFLVSADILGLFRIPCTRGCKPLNRLLWSKLPAAIAKVAAHAGPATSG
jgi:hypothetical protein